MSLKNLWERNAMERRHIATMTRLRHSAFESDSGIDHIHIKEVVHDNNTITPFGMRAPLCMTQPLGVRQLRIHPYISSSPRLCRDCEKKLQEIRVRGLT